MPRHQLAMTGEQSVSALAPGLAWVYSNACTAAVLRCKRLLLLPLLHQEPTQAPTIPGTIFPAGTIACATYAGATADALVATAANAVSALAGSSSNAAICLRAAQPNLHAAAHCAWPATNGHGVQCAASAARLRNAPVRPNSTLALLPFVTLM